MAGYKSAIFVGNLTADPELRSTASGISVCNFRLAVNTRQGDNEVVDFFDFTAWRELGETIANYKKKGDPLLVDATPRYEQWETNEGDKRSKVSFVCKQVQFLNRSGSKEGGYADGRVQRGQKAASQAKRPKPQDQEPLPEEDFDDIPF